MKKFIASLLAILLLCGMAGLTACTEPTDASPPPALEEVYDRLVTLIEASGEVNVLLFGEGLPTYPRGDAEDILTHRYFGADENGLLYVTPYAKFRSIVEMQTAISAVYSVAYRESLFESLFTGYTGVTSTVMPARYHEDDVALYQNVYVEPLVTEERVYDYAGMEIIEEESTSTYLRVSIPSYTESRPHEWKRVTLSFVYENGDWYLDSPSC